MCMRFASRSLPLLAALLALVVSGIATAQDFTLRQQLGAIASGEGAANGLFGWDVAVDGDLAVACDVRLDGSPARVRTWRRSGQAWQRLPMHDVVLSGDSGCRLALAEGTLAITQYRSIAPSRGYVHIFSWTEQGWEQEYGVSSTVDYYDAIATSGNIVVAGVPLYDGTGDNGGRVRVWRRDGSGNWSSESISLSTPQDGAFFGQSVAIVSGAIVVGAPGMDVDAGGTLREDAGAAYVYELTIDTWNLAATLTESDGEIGANHRFGTAVAISGLDPGTPDRLLVSSPSNEAAAHAGIVRAYTRGAGTWNEAFSFDQSGSPTDDQFGCSLAMDGAWAVVGICTNGSVAENAGAVRILRFNDEFDGVANWALRTDPDGVANDYLGVRAGIDRDGPVTIVGQSQADLYGNPNQGVVLTSVGTAGDIPALTRSLDLGQGLTDAGAAAVAVDADVLVVGAYNEAVGSQRGRGAAYVFRRGGGGQYQFEQRVLAPDGLAGDAFGFSVAVRGDVMLVGAIGRGLAGVESAGAVYAFRRSAGQWALEKVLTPVSAGDGTSMGLSLAFDGSTAFIGERRQHVGVYARDAGGNWTLAQDLDHDGGDSIALSGELVALGHSAAQVGGDYVGQVALYRRAAGLWQLDDVLSGAAGDQQFGTEVGLHGDLLAAASNAEHVPVLLYRRVGNEWLPEGSLLPDDLPLTTRCHHVAAAGDRVAFGCWDDPGTSGDSWVYVYAKGDAGWSFVQRIEPPGAQPHAAHGYSLAWQGNLLFAGALGMTIDFDGQGAVYVYAGDRLFRDGFE